MAGAMVWGMVSPSFGGPFSVRVILLGETRKGRFRHSYEHFMDAFDNQFSQLPPPISVEAISKLVSLGGVLIFRT